MQRCHSEVLGALDVSEVKSRLSTNAASLMSNDG